IGRDDDEVIAERTRCRAAPALHRGRERRTSIGVREHEPDRALVLPGAARACGEYARCDDSEGERQHDCSVHFDSSFRWLIRQATFTCGWSVAIVKRPFSSSAVIRVLLGGSRSRSSYSSGGSSGPAPAGSLTVAWPRASVHTSPW